MTENHSAAKRERAVLFDWGDTLMRVFPQYDGPMIDWPEIELMPNAALALEQLHPTWTVVLATDAKDSNEEQIRQALERGRILKWIDAVYCCSNTGHPKPAPDFFAAVSEALQLPPERMVMVGDRYESDVLGARNAGLLAIWYRPGWRGGAGRRNVVQNLYELPALLEDLLPLRQE